MRANERTDERVAQYLRLYSCLFQTTVPPPSAEFPCDSSFVYFTFLQYLMRPCISKINFNLKFIKSVRLSLPQLMKLMKAVGFQVTLNILCGHTCLCQCRSARLSICLLITYKNRYVPHQIVPWFCFCLPIQ